MPTVWQDWDMEKGSVTDHKRRQTKVIIEMLLMMVVRAGFHALMLLPIIFTGKFIILTQLSSSVLNVRKDLVRENFHARLVLFIS